MASRPETDLQIEIASEIGLMRYEAICHFLIDGDYKADHEGDCAGAFGEYAKAWSLLVTAKARRLGGCEILAIMADLAADAGDPRLVEQTEALLTAYRQEVDGDLDPRPQNNKL